MSELAHIRIKHQVSLSQFRACFCHLETLRKQLSLWGGVESGQDSIPRHPPHGDLLKQGRRRRGVPSHDARP